MTARRVPVTLPVGDQRVHRFQILRAHQETGGHEDWIVVDFSPAGIHLASVDFEWTRTVPTRAIRDGTMEPLTADGVPIWGY